ncbi:MULTISPECIES: hypothetical protein [Bacillus]|uniref:hypothetical protein n=1 Tax=Bacillus TaxID=1386 RepID=UPI000BF91A60|nr:MULTISPECIES: hypothetical protein [Bacillus]KAF6700428.1 hypothetical protein HFD78_09905 [Bacillus sp. EKM501B]PFS08395.1 hypothetical protein COK60_01555 [Bacillus thuringiensis]
MENYIFVAGVDYEFKGVDFRVFCNNRISRLLAQNLEKKDIQFQVFDFRKGEIVTHQITYNNGTKSEKRVVRRTFKPISKKNYDVSLKNGTPYYSFRRGQHEVLSILDVYEAVKNIGAHSPKTLKELSFFSHGWMGGPILVNSFHNRDAFQESLRDPDDKDPRGQLDFIPPTMSSKAKQNLQKAFHPKGFIWIWGCAFPNLIHQILTKVEKNPAYKEQGLGDDDLLFFTNFNKEEANVLQYYLEPSIGRFSNYKKIELPFKYLKYFFCIAIQASYSFQIAVNAKIKTYGALLGTYAEYERGNFPLLRVPGVFKRHLAFYSNYLGFSLDFEGRNYGEFRADLTCHFI